jgi:hypothetical protein
LDEAVSLDPALCPTLLSQIKEEYWPHIVNEDFMVNFFVDLDFLLRKISGERERNLETGRAMKPRAVQRER